MRTKSGELVGVIFTIFTGDIGLESCRWISPAGEAMETLNVPIRQVVHLRILISTADLFPFRGEEAGVLLS